MESRVAESIGLYIKEQPAPYIKASYREISTLGQRMYTVGISD